jgi:uncharacterized protein
MKILLKKIEKIAKGHFRSALSCHDWDHVQRVYNLALLIGKNEKAKMNIVKVAVLLHDIKRNEEMLCGGKFCHALEGAKEAEKILRQLKLEESFVLAVKHSIEAHRFRNNIEPATLEAKVLSDADKLDALGAIGVGRGFLWSGKHGLRLHNTDSEVTKRDSSNSREHCLYAEYMIKLRFLKDRMFTKTGQKIAQERTSFMKSFLERLDKEVKGKL